MTKFPSAKQKNIQGGRTLVVGKFILSLKWWFKLVLFFCFFCSGLMGRGNDRRNDRYSRSGGQNYRDRSPARNDRYRERDRNRYDDRRDRERGRDRDRDRDKKYRHGRERDSG